MVAKMFVCLIHMPVDEHPSSEHSRSKHSDNDHFDSEANIENVSFTFKEAFRP